MLVVDKNGVRVQAQIPEQLLDVYGDAVATVGRIESLRRDPEAAITYILDVVMRNPA
jgi:hypothetical protein